MWIDIPLCSILALDPDPRWLNLELNTDHRQQDTDEEDQSDNDTDNSYRNHPIMASPLLTHQNIPDHANSL